MEAMVISLILLGYVVALCGGTRYAFNTPRRVVYRTVLVTYKRRK